MCIAFCHRQAVLYWNHADCSFEFCPVVAETPRHCNSCRYRQDDICDLTRAPLPEQGGCCHWNVEPVTTPQQVTLEMLTPLNAGPEPTEELLTSLDAPYELDTAGQIWVNPDRLGVPETYGLGTEDLVSEMLDWSDWEETWQRGDSP